MKVCRRGSGREIVGKVVDMWERIGKKEEK